MGPGADAVLALVSGVPLVALGALLLVLRPLRRQQLFFGCFAILWGLQVVTANIGRVTCDAHLHHVMLLISHGFMATATLFLAHFAGTVRGGRHAWAPAAITGTIGVAALAVFALRPDLLVANVAAEGCPVFTTYGPLLAPLFQIPFFLTFVAATAYLHHAYRRTRPGTTRHLLRGVILALTLFASYQFVRTTVAYLDFGDAAQFASSAVTTSAAWSERLLVGAFTAGTILLGGIAAYAAWRPPAPEARDLPLFAAFAAPALVALGEDLFQDLSLLTLETLGFWRLVSVAILAYTLAQNQVVGLELRLKRLAGPGTAGAIGLFGVPLALSLAQGEFGWQATLLTLLPEVIAIGAVLMFSDGLGRKLFPGVDDTIDYQHQRRLELYKVALEDALGRNEDPAGIQMQMARARFGITDDEHRLLLWMAQSQNPQHDPHHGTTLAPGQIILGRYRLERTLGEHTRRETLLATDIKSKQKVVVKAVDLQAYDGAGAALLTREARLGASITHPNVLTIFDVAEDGTHLLILMDYADMGDLSAHLRRHGPMTPPAAVRFLSELLAALQAIHDRGIIHRNLKPGNVLLDADGRVLLADLSAAIEASEVAAGKGDNEDLATQLLYDPLYLSPEQLRGAPTSQQSDLYVAGLLFHLVLTGRYPYPITGCSDAQIRSLLLDHRPELTIDGAVAWARPLVLRAMEKDPNARYASAHAMRADLHERAGLPPPRSP